MELCHYSGKDPTRDLHRDLTVLLNLKCIRRKLSRNKRFRRIYILNKEIIRTPYNQNPVFMTAIPRLKDLRGLSDARNLLGWLSPQDSVKDYQISYASCQTIADIKFKGSRSRASRRPPCRSTKSQTNSQPSVESSAAAAVATRRQIANVC